MLEDTDFEFPKMESKLDRVWVAWDNFSNDKEKRRYCDELEEVIQDLMGSVHISILTEQHMLDNM